MPRGRPRKPDSEKKLAGNPGRRALGSGGAARKMTAAERPKCPPHLNDEARAEWKRATAQLESLGLLHKADTAALATYCVIWSDCVKASAELERDGRWLEEPIVYRGTVVEGVTRKVPHPALKFWQQSRTALLNYAQRLGLTPDSRGWTRTTAPVAEEDDGFDEYLDER